MKSAAFFCHFTMTLFCTQYDLIAYQLFPRHTLAMKWGIAVRIHKKTILYAAGVLACGNIALQVLGFAYRVLLSHYAGAEGLGIYRLVNSIYLVYNAGCLSGVTMACSRLSAACEAKGERKKIRAILRLAFRVFLAMCVLCSAILLIWQQEISENLLGDQRCARAFPFLLLCLGLTGIENIFKSLFIGLERMQYAAISEVAEQLIRIGAVWLLLSQYQGGDYGTIAMLIFCGMVASEIFSASFLTILFRRGLAGSTPAAPLDNSTARQFFFIALPVSASALLCNAISSAGSILLPKRLMLAGLSYEQALSALGVLSGMAMPLLLLPIALVSSVCTALLPAVTAAEAIGNHRRVCALTGRAITTVGLIGVPATAVLVPLAPALSKRIFGQPLSMPYVSLLGIAVILCYYQMTAGSLLNALGLQHWQVFISVSAELCQVFLMYRLCASPTWGIYGYLLSMAFTEMLAFVASFTLLHRRLGFALYPLRRFGVPILCGGALYGWTSVFFTWFEQHSSSETAALVWTAVGAVALYLLVLRLMGIHLWQYLSRRIEKNTLPRLHLL